MSDASSELTRLLELWRAARHVSTSELIHRVGELVDFTPSPLTKKSKKSAIATWLTETQREGPATLSARLTQLIPLLADASAPTVWPLFEALSLRPPDPRIATLATRVLVRDVKADLWSDKMLRRLLNCVEVHGDRGHFLALEAGLPRTVLLEGVAQRAARLVKKGLAETPSGPELPQSERAALVTQKWEVGELKSQPDLFAHVYEDPFDLSRRHVLADALQEAGDPRGEFIALQLGHRDEKRQRALLKAHRKQWLGPFAPYAADARFEEGFVSELRLKPLKPAQFSALSATREWATVKRVQPGVTQLSRHMLSLEDPGYVPHDALRAALRAKFQPPLTVLTTEFEAPAHLETLLAFPRLRGVTVRARGLRALETLLKTPWPALESLGVLQSNPTDAVTAWLFHRDVTRVRSFAIHDWRGFDSLLMEREGAGFVLRLHNVVHLFGQPAGLQQVARLLDARPTRVVAHFKYGASAYDEAALRNLAEPRGIPVEWWRGALPER